MKVLSVRCQYAYLICLGIKDIENRTWNWKYRGPLLIHSSGKDCDEVDISCFPRKWQEEIDEHGKQGVRYTNKLDKFYEQLYKYYGTKDYEKWKEKDYYMKSQAIIGKVDLVDIVKNNQAEWAEEGQWHWILKNAELFKMPIIHVKGQLRPFEYEYKD